MYYSNNKNDQGIVEYQVEKIEKNQEKDVKNDVRNGVDYQAEYSSFQEEEMNGAKDLSNYNVNDDIDFTLNNVDANGESYPLAGIEDLEQDALDREDLSNYDEVKLDLGEVKDDADSLIVWVLMKLGF